MVLQVWRGDADDSSKWRCFAFRPRNLSAPHSPQERKELGRGMVASHGLCQGTNHQAVRAQDWEVGGGLPIYTHVHGEWLSMQNLLANFYCHLLLVREDSGSQVRSLCHHDITHGKRQKWNYTFT